MRIPGSAAGPRIVRCGTALALVAALAACGGGEAEADGAGVASGETAVAATTSSIPGPSADFSRPSAPLEVEATPEDWRILRDLLVRAEDDGADTLAVGDAVATVGLYFVGTSYEPGTLEVPGDERLVVNLRTLDCVTLVETALAMVHTLREPGTVRAWSDEALRSRYARALASIRYRDSVLRGYPSRLHYFSEWMRDAEEKGMVRIVTRELGGMADSEPIDFMSTHPDAYRQLADSGVLEEIRRTEETLSGIPRHYLPEGEIDGAAGGIETGDVIAATSTVRGLDVAHTGIALWRDGALHLLHAPLVGDSVQVSPRTLARRIQEIEGQDGIMVARPLPTGSFAPAPGAE